MTVTFESTQTASPPVGTVVASDTIGGIDYQRIKVVWGTTGTATELTTSAGLPVQLTAQSSALNVTTTPSSQITASVAPTTQWTVSTTPTSQITASVTPSSQFTVTTVPSSQTTVSVTPTTQFTVTTTPSSNISVILTSGSLNLGYMILSSSTSTSITVPPIIGSVAPTTQWTVTTTPSSQATVSVTPTTQFTVSTTPTSQITASVTPTSQFTVTTTPSSQATVTSVLSSGSLTLGYMILSSSTSTSITVPPIIGSVAPSTQWTVSTTPTSQITASVTPTTQFTVTTTPSSQVTVTAITTAIQAFAADAGTIFSSGVAQTPLFHTIATGATGNTAITTAVAAKIQVLLAMTVTNGSNSVASQFSIRDSATSSTLVAVSGLGANGSVTLPYNPVGWAVTTTTAAFNLNVASTGTPVIGGCMTFVAI